MLLVPRDRSRLCWLVCVLLLVSLSACGTAYRFQYRYTMIDPAGGSEGVQDTNVRIHLTAASGTGLLHLTVANQSVQPITIVWGQTHYIDPRGRRQEASEAGVAWFFRPQEWFAEGTPIAPGREFRGQIQPGAPQTYNPFTISRQASGAIHVSTSPRPLFPLSGSAAAVGKAYQGQEFRFVLALRIGTKITRYPFTFRITAVDVQSQRDS